MIYELLTGKYHIRRKLAYLFDWDYVESDAPTPQTLRQRHLLMKQIEFTKHKKIKLRTAVTNDLLLKQVIQPIIDQINKTPHYSVSFDPADYSDTSSDDVDISEYK